MYLEDDIAKIMTFLFIILQVAESLIFLTCRHVISLWHIRHALFLLQNAVCLSGDHQLPILVFPWIKPTVYYIRDRTLSIAQQRRFTHIIVLAS